MSNFPHADLVDVSDLTDRVDELRADLEAHHDEQDTTLSFEYALQDVANFTGMEDEHAELAELQAVLSGMEGNGGDHQWEGNWYPATLIADSYFETAMDDLLEDIGDVPRNLPAYLTITVDYSALQQDYSSIEIDGTTYWYR